MANLDELRARMDRLGRHLAEAQGRATTDRPGNADIRDIADRHAALSTHLAKTTDADAQVQGEVEALLNAFGHWAEAQDKEFGQG
jgi:hypothetical protein